MSNTLTLVQHEKKPIRICLDARRINKLMIADRVKVSLCANCYRNFMDQDGGVLLQKSDDGHYNIVSTASLALSALNTLLDT